MKTFLLSILMLMYASLMSQHVPRFFSTDSLPPAYAGIWEPSVDPFHSHTGVEYIKQAETRSNTWNWGMNFRPFDSTHYEYDQENELVLETTYRWEGTSIGYLPYQQWSYASEADSSFSIYSTWDADEQGWLKAGRQTSIRDSLGNILSILGEGWDSNSHQWNRVGLTLFFRDAHHRDTLELVQRWQASTMEWRTNEMIRTVWSPFDPQYTVGYLHKALLYGGGDTICYEKNSFDAVGHMLTHEKFTFDAPPSGSRRSWTYNQQGLPVEILYSYFDPWLDIWVEDLRSLYQYKGPGYFDLDTITTFKWQEDGSFQGWATKDRKAYLKPSSGTTEVWLETGIGHTNWALSSRTTSHTDMQSGALSMSLGESWDGSSWLRSSKAEYEYTPNLDQTLYRYSTWDGTAWSPQGLRRTYYFTVPVGLDEHILPELKIYPNPARNDLSISLGEAEQSLQKIEILTLQGKRIQSLEAHQLNRSGGVIHLSVSSVPSGIYIFCLQLDGQSISRRWVKQ
ncbi:MAG: T9SS type A sorting domain-containing protein [Bacteroidota bacterium]